MTAIASPVSHPDTLEEWDRLMAAYVAGKAADEEINKRYDAAYSAFQADKPAKPQINTVLLFGILMGNCDLTRRRLLHSDDLDQLQHQIIAATGVTRWERVDRNPQRIAELDKVREYRRLLAEAEQRHNLPALEEEWTAVGHRLADARAALLLAPAPDYVAVQWKLDDLFGPEATGAVGDDDRSIPSWDCKFTDTLIADMARLGGVG
jgi:hypothetical protein